MSQSILLPTTETFYHLFCAMIHGPRIPDFLCTVLFAIRDIAHPSNEYARTNAFLKAYEELKPDPKFANELRIATTCPTIKAITIQRFMASIFGAKDLLFYD